MFNLPTSYELERRAGKIIRSKYRDGHAFNIAMSRAIDNAADQVRIDREHIVAHVNQHDAERFDGLF